MASRPSINPLKQQQAQIKRRMMMAAMTPMTMPAMAPPLNPPPELDSWPIMTLPPVLTGVTNGCVVVAVPVAVPVEVIVTRELLVGRSGTLAVLVTTVVTVKRLLY